MAIILVTTMAFPALAADVEKNPNLINSEEHESYVYNGNIPSDIQLIASTVAAYTLQDSTVYGSWSNAYIQYNCYAYALGLTDGNYWPGYFSNTPNRSDFDIDDSIYSLACDVKADLKSSTFSNKCVVVTTARPAELSSGLSCMCIRKGDDDFHFMKMSGSSWYHKPGPSNPLKYKYKPSTSRTWSNECSINGVTRAPDIYYDSAIYYIIYSKDHITTYTWTGDHYHSGTKHYYKYGYKCDNCGIYTSTVWISRDCSGPPCNTPWSLTPTPEVS